MRAEETYGWLLREMLVEGGRLRRFARTPTRRAKRACKLVWTAEEIAEALGPANAAFMAAYDVRREGNWEGRNVLRPARRTWR